MGVSQTVYHNDDVHRGDTKRIRKYLFVQHSSSLPIQKTAVLYILIFSIDSISNNLYLMFVALLEILFVSCGNCQTSITTFNNKETTVTHIKNLRKTKESAAVQIQQQQQQDSIYFWSLSEASQTPCARKMQTQCLVL